MTALRFKPAAAVWLTLLVAGVAMAGDAGRESPFTAGAGARALGMGGGFTSIANDASALFYNPAGLSRIDQQELTLMHMTLAEGTLYDFASWAYPAPTLGGFGIGFMRLGTGDIVKREGYQEVGTFDFAYSQFLLSYGRKLQGGLFTGVSLKIVNQSLDTYSDYGIGLDFGMMARLSTHVSFGMIARDIVPATLELRTVEETLPVTVAGGIAISDVALSGLVRASAAFELEKTEDRSARVHSGAELILHDAYALRAGYDRDNPSLGAGFRYGRLKVDYAFKFVDYIDDSHRFSVTYLLGTPVSEQERRRQLEQERRSTTMLADERQRQFDLFREKADRFYEQFRLDSALTYYQRALAFDEDNEEIIGTIAGIERAREIEEERLRALQESERELRQAVEAYFAQAESFFAKKYYPAALDMLELVLYADPYHGEAQRLKKAIEDAVAGEIIASFIEAAKARSDGDYVRALELYTRILYLKPSNQEALAAKQEVAEQLDLARLLNQGMDLFRAGEYVQARKHFLSVLSASPGEPVAQEYLKRIDTALESPPTLEVIQQDRVIWQYYLDGLRYMRDREYQKAIEAWERVLEAYPNNQNTLNNIEQARLRLQPERGE